ncbi:P-loop containing nucleoside triphosphate hydrolase protein, partial [Ascobolus immersus RN42]
RGLLLCLEGPDRTGKTTQSHLLSTHLTSLTHRPTHTLRFPDRTTPTGKLIDAYLKDTSVQLNPRVSHLLFSANRWEVMDSVLAKVRGGENVVMDRYHGSGEAYTCSLDGFEGEGGGEEWARGTDRGLPRPDVTVCLYLPEGEAGKRGGFGEERY